MRPPLHHPPRPLHLTLPSCTTATTTSSFNTNIRTDTNNKNNITNELKEIVKTVPRSDHAPQLPMTRQSSIPRVSRPQVPVTAKRFARFRAMRRPTRSISTSCTLSDLVHAIELDAALSRDAASVLAGALVNVVPDKSKDEGRVHLVQQQRRQDMWARLECERTKEVLTNNNKTADLHARWIQNHMERAKQCCSSSSLFSRPHSQRLVPSYA
ncbi:hypothetical protein BGZ59_006497 [Podila verticillata]|nr:hypothetical protein BGZ59_006497 [Podila verticillata]KFH71762.1 hypothetical protein MVEG_02057 [Podila verticillata NRRL 6337]